MEVIDYDIRIEVTARGESKRSIIDEVITVSHSKPSVGSVHEALETFVGVLRAAGIQLPALSIMVSERVEDANREP